MKTNKVPVQNEQHLYLSESNLVFEFNVFNNQAHNSFILG